MGMFWRCVLVVLGSLTAGVVLFAGSFVVLDFIWTHLVVRNPKDIGLGDGVMVVGGGLIVGCTLGIGSFAYSLYKFWPRAR
jgi:hypothetical protein